MYYGAEVVDEGFTWARDEEKAGGKEPHCGTGEEDAGFGIQEHSLFDGAVRVVRFGGQRGRFRVLVMWRKRAVAVAVRVLAVV